MMLFGWIRAFVLNIVAQHGRIGGMTLDLLRNELLVSFHRNHRSINLQAGFSLERHWKKLHLCSNV